LTCARCAGVIFALGGAALIFWTSCGCFDCAIATSVSASNAIAINIPNLNVTSHLGWIECIPARHRNSEKQDQLPDCHFFP
jgi:hypothetical protein